MTEIQRRVVKVGGSLLPHPALASVLTQWLEQQAPMINALVVGGGVWADEVRALDAGGRLPPATAHWLAIRAMKLTSWLLCQLLPQAALIDRLVALDQTVEGTDWGVDVPRIFDCESFLREVEPQLPGCPLPVGWQVTSDSIAARLAAVIRASELVLLKSTDPPAGDLDQAAQLGLVDAHFPQAAAPLACVRWVNLRNLLGASATPRFNKKN